MAGGATPRPTVTRPAGHRRHHGSWGSEEEGQPRPHAQLHGQAQRREQTSPEDRNSSQEEDGE